MIKTHVFPSPVLSPRRRENLDTDVAAWRDAIDAAGSSVSLAALADVNTLAVALKDAGLWEKCYAITPRVGDDLTAALIRLKVPAGVARSYTNTNFPSGAYSESVGLTGNGTTRRLGTGINPAALGWSAQSLMTWAYITTPITESAIAFAMGCRATSDGGAVMLYYRGSVTREVVGVGAESGSNTAQAGTSGPLVGLTGGGTNGSAAQQFYHNGTPSGAPIVGTKGLPNAEIYEFAHNNWSGPESYSPRTMASAYITAGMSPAEVSAFYGIVQAFETARGRAV